MKTIQKLSSHGVKVRWNGRGLCVSPPKNKQDGVQLALFEQLKDEAEAEARRDYEEQAALKEIGLSECKKFCTWIVKKIGLLPVHLSGLYEVYVGELSREKHGDILIPATFEEFRAAYAAAELALEQAAILQASERLTPVEADHLAGFPPVAAPARSEILAKVQLDEAVLKEQGLASSRLAKQQLANTKTPPQKAAALKGNKAPLPVPVVFEIEVRFSDCLVPVGNRAELIHPDFREGLDPDDASWLNYRTDRITGLEHKARKGDSEAQHQLGGLREEALIILGGRVRAVPRNALAKVRDGP